MSPSADSSHAVKEPAMREVLSPQLSTANGVPSSWSPFMDEGSRMDTSSDYLLFRNSY